MPWLLMEVGQIASSAEKVTESHTLRCKSDTQLKLCSRILVTLYQLNVCSEQQKSQIYICQARLTLQADFSF